MDENTLIITESNKLIVEYNLTKNNLIKEVTNMELMSDAIAKSSKLDNKVLSLILQEFKPSGELYGTNCILCIVDRAPLDNNTIISMYNPSCDLCPIYINSGFRCDEHESNYHRVEEAWSIKNTLEDKDRLYEIGVKFISELRKKLKGIKQ